METLERLRSTSSHEEWQLPQGDPTKQPLNQDAEVMQEEHKPEELFCTESKSGAQGHGQGSFSAILRFEILR